MGTMGTHPSVHSNRSSSVSLGSSESSVKLTLQYSSIYSTSDSQYITTPLLPQMLTPTHPPTPTHTHPPTPTPTPPHTPGLPMHIHMCTWNSITSLDTSGRQDFVGQTNSDTDYIHGNCESRLADQTHTWCIPMAYVHAPAQHVLSTACAQQDEHGQMKHNTGNLKKTHNIVGYHIHAQQDRWLRLYTQMTTLP